MTLPKSLAQIFLYIDQNKEEFLKRLESSIAIPSVHGINNETKGNILNMIKWTQEQLNKVGVITEIRDIQDKNCEFTFIPPLILGKLETLTCPNKPNVLIYSHLDVDAAKLADGWKNEPFELNKADDFIYGRGVVTKGSLCSWLNAIESYKTLGIDLPVNIKFIIESMGTLNSLGLKKFLSEQKHEFLAHVDYICLSKGYWLESDMPSLIHSLKGLCNFSINVECASWNLDSNKYNGIVQEAMSDMIFLLKSLIDDDGNLNIPSVTNSDNNSDKDSSLYENAEIDLNNLLQDIGSNSLTHGGSKKDVLKHHYFLPSVTVSEIRRSFNPAYYNRDIPSSVNAKVSIKFSCNCNSQTFFELIESHLQHIWQEHKSNNKLSIHQNDAIDPWHADTDDIHYKVGIKAIQQVYGKPPLSLRNGIVLPIVNLFSATVGRSLILLPISTSEGVINEKMKMESYHNAAKVFAAYLYEMVEPPRPSSKSSSSFVSCKSQTEICICEKLEERLQPASGDAENCTCSEVELRVKNTEGDDGETLLQQETQQQENVIPPEVASRVKSTNGDDAEFCSCSSIQQQQNEENSTRSEVVSRAISTDADKEESCSCSSLQEQEHITHAGVTGQVEKSINDDIGEHREVPLTYQQNGLKPNETEDVRSTKQIEESAEARSPPSDAPSTYQQKEDVSRAISRDADKEESCSCSSLQEQEHIIHAEVTGQVEKSINDDIGEHCEVSPTYQQKELKRNETEDKRSTKQIEESAEACSPPCDAPSTYQQKELEPIETDDEKSTKQIEEPEETHSPSGDDPSSYQQKELEHIETDDEKSTKQIEEPAESRSPPQTCKCLPISNTSLPFNGEILSIPSNFSALSQDPTPSTIAKEKSKVDETPSVDTIKCTCIPKRYRNMNPKEDQILSQDKQQELSKSMRRVGSEISGLSAKESEENYKMPKMLMLGCVCPENSTETVCDILNQIDKTMCPIKEVGGDLCTEGGTIKHRVMGPSPIDEEYSEITLGPLSHCSCNNSLVSIILAPPCDCKEGPIYTIAEVPENMENEVD